MIGALGFITQAFEMLSSLSPPPPPKPSVDPKNMDMI